MTRLTHRYNAGQRAPAPTRPAGRMWWLVLPALLGAAVLLGPLSSSLARAASEAASVDADILFDDNRLKACGVSAAFGGGEGGEGAVRIAIRLTRIGDAETRWSIEADGPGIAGDTVPVLYALTTSHDTRKVFGAAARTAGGGIAASGPMPGLEGSTFIQEIMVSGVRVMVEAPGAAPRAFAITGPLATTVRQMYLMCAGDLFR